MRWMNVGVVTLAVMGCAPTGEPESSAAVVRQQIEARGADFIRFYEAGEVDSVVALFTENAQLIPPGIPAVVGHEAIRQHVSQGIAIGGWSSSVTTESVIHCGQLAIERGRYTLRFQPNAQTPEGMTAFTQSGDHLIHWTLIGGRWSIETYMGSIDGPPEPL